jgi:hypothetical protein
MMAALIATAADRRQTLWIGDGSTEEWVKYEDWVARLRPCTPADIAGAKRPLPEQVEPLVRSKQPVAMKGRLVPGRAECSLVGWKPPGVCLNGCNFDWVVVPRRECPDWRFPVRRADHHLRLQGGGSDCGVGGFGAQAVEVIVTGHLERRGTASVEDATIPAAMVATEMCRLDGRDASRLSDADLAALTAARAVTRKCPSLPKPPSPPPPAPPARPRSDADKMGL